MNIMSKRGQQDNIVTYEHWCDTVADLANIDPQYVTLGSVAIVVRGAAGLEAYIADSQKQWVLVVGGVEEEEEEEEEGAGGDNNG